MATFQQFGIKFDYTLTSAIIGQQPQPAISDARRVEIGTAVSTFRASVTATALSGVPAEVTGKWRAGFIQEIQASSRIGHYHKDVRTEDRLFEVPTFPGQPGKSMRDSQGGEEPYDGHSADLVHGVAAVIESEDDPRLELPLDLQVDGVGRTLTNVTGGDRFTIWLAATRDGPPRHLVILRSLEWRVNWRAVVTSGRNTAMVPLLQLVAHELPDLTQPAGFSHGPLPAGYPQDLTDIEGNDFFYRITCHRGIEIHRGEIDADPTEPSAAFSKFPKKRAKGTPWW